MDTPSHDQPAPQPSAPPAPSGSSNRATTALVLGIVSVVCCQLLGPVAWYLGNEELKAVKTGLSPASAEGMAKAGMILGIIGSILLILWILWVVFFGGMAIIGALLGG